MDIDSVEDRCHAIELLVHLCDIGTSALQWGASNFSYCLSSNPNLHTPAKFGSLYRNIFCAHLIGLSSTFAEHNVRWARLIFSEFHAQV